MLALSTFIVSLYKTAEAMNCHNRVSWWTSMDLKTRYENRCPRGVSVSCLASQTRHECPQHNNTGYIVHIYLKLTDTEHRRTRQIVQYAISQLRSVRSGLHLVTYLDVGNFCDKSTETTLHEMCVQVFLRFSDSSKTSQFVSLSYELAWLAGIGKSEKNLLKTSCKVASLTKVAHIF